MLVDIPPALTISPLVNNLKPARSRRLRRRFAGHISFTGSRRSGTGHITLEVSEVLLAKQPIGMSNSKAREKHHRKN